MQINFMRTLGILNNLKIFSMSGKEDMRFLIADDHAIVRKGIRQILLDEFPNVTIDEVANGNDLLENVRIQKYEVIILDISMPGRSGLEILKQMKSFNIASPVLILSMHPEDQYAIRVLKAGASGFLSKDIAAEELVNAVKKLLSGRKYITETVAEKLALGVDIATREAQHEILSDREFEVLKLIASGKTVSEIAGLLHLSVATVSTYRTRILDKMHLKNNAELTHYVISQGIN